MTANVALVTGSSGLVGSETVAHFDAQGWTVHGVDNNMRRDFFGPDGDTSENLLRLRAVTRRFSHHVADIRDRQAMFDLIRAARPSLIVHCASQPSHDLARDRPVRRLRGQRVGHAEPAGGGPPVLPRIALRLHEHQ